jgi:hypothetical protein
MRAEPIGRSGETVREAASVVLKQERSPALPNRRRVRAVASDQLDFWPTTM